MTDKPSRLEVFKKMAVARPGDPFVWYALAMEHRSLGDLPTSLRAFEDVRDRFPDYVATYLMAGQVAGELAQFDVAREWLTAGARVAEKMGDSHAHGELMSALGSLPA